MWKSNGATANMKKQIKAKGTAYKKYTDNKPEIKRDLGKCSEQKL